jgi:hypothetical protein
MLDHYIFLDLVSLILSYVMHHQEKEGKLIKLNINTL